MMRHWAAFASGFGAAYDVTGTAPLHPGGTEARSSVAELALEAAALPASARRYIRKLQPLPPDILHALIRYTEEMRTTIETAIIEYKKARNELIMALAWILIPTISGITIFVMTIMGLLAPAWGIFGELGVASTAWFSAIKGHELSNILRKMAERREVMARLVTGFSAYLPTEGLSHG
jgi:hypothetical protein